MSATRRNLTCQRSRTSICRKFRFVTITRTEEIYSIRDDPDAMALVLISEQPAVFEVPIEAVERHRYLQDAIAYVDDVTDRGVLIRITLVTRPSFKSLNPATFRSIAEYLRFGDFVPAIEITPNGTGAFLKDVVTENERFLQMEKLSHIFNMARDLQIFDIFSNIARRFDILSPWPPTLLLTMMRSVLREEFTEDDGERTLRDSMVEQTAKTYSAIIATDNSRNLLHLFETDREWASLVFTRLAEVFAGT